MASTGTMQAMETKSAIRIVIFDDSRDSLVRFKSVFQNSTVDLLLLRRPVLDESARAALLVFCPDLIVTDLVIGESREDGYRLIDQIREIEFACGVPPIVVCSKLFTHSPMGEAERGRALREQGVVAAFGKFPDFPSAEALLGFVRGLK